MSFFSSCFKDFFVFRFQKFSPDMSWHGFLWVYLVWGLLSFWIKKFMSLNKFGRFSAITLLYIYIYFSPAFFLLSSGTPVTEILSLCYSLTGLRLRSSPHPSHPQFSFPLLFIVGVSVVYSALSSVLFCSMGWVHPLNFSFSVLHFIVLIFPLNSSWYHRLFL